MLKPPRLRDDRADEHYWNPLDDAQVAQVQTAADWVLEHLGLEVREHPATLERMAAVGARVVGNRVMFEPGQARALVRATVPRSFVQSARNPERNVMFGGGGTITAPLAGAPMVRGRDGCRRYATQTDHDDFARLAHQFSVIDHAGCGYCELTDQGSTVRHLTALSGMLKLTDKPIMGAARHPAQVQDSLDMARLVFGEERFTRECCLINLFNLESPLVLTAPTAEGIRLTVEAGQAAIVTSYAILGMNTPVTLGSALPLMLAEIEAGLAVAQSFAPGAPAIAGWYGAPFSMSAMRPAFGAIESMMIMAAGAQLVRTLGCPVRGDGSVTAAKIADQQAASDAARGLDVARMTGVDFALHSAGWLEGGLSASFEKFMLDVDTISILSGHRADGAGYGDWRAALAAHEPPEMRPAVAEDLDRFVADRTKAYRGADDHGTE